MGKTFQKNTSSSPARGTNVNGLVVIELPNHFLVKTDSVSAVVSDDISITAKRLMKPDKKVFTKNEDIYISDNGLQYKKAHLIIPSPTSKDQRWVIAFYCWNVQKNKLVRERDTSCNKITDLEKRKRWCQQQIKIINTDLKSGWHIDIDKKERENILAKITTSSRNIKLIDALEFALSLKASNKPRTYTTYKNFCNKLYIWLEKKHLHHMLLTQFTGSLFHIFLIDLQKNEGIKPRTYNNYLNAIKTLINDLMKHLNKPQENNIILYENPLKNINTLSHGMGKNVAFNKDQVSELLTFMSGSAKREALKFVCQWMYYTCDRTEEQCSLQIKHINYHVPGKIYYPKENTKNSYEKHVTICDELQRLIDEHNLLSYPPDYYIFSAGSYTPGPIKADSKRLGASFGDNVLRKLKYSKDYTLYSWKHTGVVALWNARVPKGEIQTQLGHIGSDSFDKYLKSLGLMESENLRSLYPSLPNL